MKKKHAEAKEKEEEKIIRRPKIKHVIRTCLKMTACIQRVYALSNEICLITGYYRLSLSRPDRKQQQQHRQKQYTDIIFLVAQRTKQFQMSNTNSNKTHQ